MSENNGNIVKLEKPSLRKHIKGYFEEVKALKAKKKAEKKPLSKAKKAAIIGAAFVVGGGVGFGLYHVFGPISVTPGETIETAEPSDIPIENVPQE